MEYVARDEDGTSHIGWSQEEANSCGPACVYMVEANARQACIANGEKRIRQLLALYFSDGVQEMVHRLLNDFNARGIGMGKLRDALKAEGYPCTMSSSLPTPLSGARLPMIAHVAWPNQSGHFIVISGVTATRKAVCLDPWYGLQQVPVASFPTYTAVCSQYAQCTAGGGGSFSGWCIKMN